MTDFTPQEEWIDRQGLFLWLAFFFSEIGAGFYLVSLFFEFWSGCLVGWLICTILGGGLHILYLGKPERAWRAILRPAKSELSRGLIIMILFTAVGAIHIAPSLSYLSSLLSSLPWRTDMVFFKIFMTILGFFVITHGFMSMNVMTAIPFWNSAILPVLSVASGIWVGTQLSMWTSIGFSEKEILLSLEPLARWSLFAYAFLTIYYFWNIGHSSPAGQESLRVIIKADLSAFFYVGVVLIGFIIPIAISLNFWADNTVSGYGLVYLRIICAIIGDLTLRYVISKSGRYSPLIYSNVGRV